MAKAKVKHSPKDVALLERTISEGFDESYISEDGGVRPRCSDCEALCINGRACHETGCPTEARIRREQEQDDFDDYGEEGP